MEHLEQDVGVTAIAAIGELQSACRLVGLDASSAHLLGPVAENATFGLPGGVVARVAGLSASERLGREVEIARWLSSEGISVVQPLRGVEQPVLTERSATTFWHDIGSVGLASTAQLGNLLRHLHELNPPAHLSLPATDPFEGMTGYLSRSSGLTPEDQTFLAGLLVDLQDANRGLRFDLPQGVVHGDAHRKNALRTRDGRAVLLDLERLGVGPREWDLVVAAVYLRLGWYSDADYGGFVSSYGYDVRDWSGFPTLVAIRELRMTLWLASRTGREPRLLPEAQRRISSLRDPEAPRSWSPGT